LWHFPPPHGDIYIYTNYHKSVGPHMKLSQFTLLRVSWGPTNWPYPANLWCHFYVKGENCFIESCYI
jgi:hypothetical protein